MSQWLTSAIVEQKQLETTSRPMAMEKVAGWIWLLGCSLWIPGTDDNIHPPQLIWVVLLINFTFVLFTLLLLLLVTTVFFLILFQKNTDICLHINSKKSTKRGSCKRSKIDEVDENALYSCPFHISVSFTLIALEYMGQHSVSYLHYWLVFVLFCS